MNYVRKLKLSAYIEASNFKVRTTGKTSYVFIQKTLKIQNNSSYSDEF